MDPLTLTAILRRWSISITITNYIKGNVFHLPLFHFRSAIYLWLKVYSSSEYLMTEKFSKVTFGKLCDSFQFLWGFSLLEYGLLSSVKRLTPYISLFISISLCLLNRMPTVLILTVLNIQEHRANLIWWAKWSLSDSTEHMNCLHKILVKVSLDMSAQKHKITQFRMQMLSSHRTEVPLGWEPRCKYSADRALHTPLHYVLLFSREMSINLHLFWGVYK